MFFAILCIINCCYVQPWTSEKVFLCSRELKIKFWVIEFSIFPQNITIKVVTIYTVTSSFMLLILSEFLIFGGCLILFFYFYFPIKLNIGIEQMY